MKVIHAVIIATFLAVLFMVAAGDPPTCPDLKPGETALLANADNCSNFYQCKFIGDPVLFDCPDETMFCSENGVCANSYDEDCEFADCTPQTPHELRLADPPTCDSETVLLANPENCSNFFICDSLLIPVLFDCPADTLFCSENASCQYPYNEDCKFKDCVKQTPHELRLADAPVCPFTADDEIVLLPNADNCNAFYECAYGIPVPFNCPDNLFFCSEKNVCAYPYDKECKFSDCAKPTPAP